MARVKQRTPKVDEVRSYVEGVAKNLVDKLYGPDGPPWGTRLTEIEEVCLAVRQVLTEKLLAEALARQATLSQPPPEPYRTCPSCRQPVPCDDTSPRLVQTRAGEAAWQEPQGYCDRCRRSFFPSDQEPGHRPV